MPSPQNVILIGLPSSGKSAIGKLLAHRLRYMYIDIDALIVNHCIIDNKNITTIQQCFSSLGEKAFRNLEKQLIKEIFENPQHDSLIISTGGGAILDPENRNSFKTNGVIVFIDTPLSIIKSRIQSQPERPLIGKNILERIDQLNAERRPIMQELADIIIDGTGPADQICLTIISQI